MIRWLRFIDRAQRLLAVLRILLLVRIGLSALQTIRLFLPERRKGR